MRMSLPPLRPSPLQLAPRYLNSDADVARWRILPQFRERWPTYIHLRIL